MHGTIPEYRIAIACELISQHKHSTIRLIYRHCMSFDSSRSMYPHCRWRKIYRTKYDFPAKLTIYRTIL